MKLNMKILNLVILIAITINLFIFILHHIVLWFVFLTVKGYFDLYGYACCSCKWALGVYPIIIVVIFVHFVL